jgi:uncharacterized membrane protein
MTSIVLTLKLVHVLGAAVLFGTGLGIAFFMYMAHRTRSPAVIAQTGRVVVIADALFTASAVIVQPVTGIALVSIMGQASFRIRAPPRRRSRAVLLESQFPKDHS